MRTKNKKLNVRLVRKIQRHILEEPRRFFMHWFIATKEDSGSEYFKSDNDTKQKFGPCGTAACIAGWANLLTGGEDAADDDRASRILGLDDSDHWMGNAYLFDAPYWPVKFTKAYRKAKTPKKRAQIASERLDHLIKIGE